MIYKSGDLPADWYGNIAIYTPNHEDLIVPFASGAPRPGRICRCGHPLDVRIFASGTRFLRSRLQIDITKEKRGDRYEG